MTQSTPTTCHLRWFVRGLRRDYQAVFNGLTLSHNSGEVEVKVNF